MLGCPSRVDLEASFFSSSPKGTSSIIKMIGLKLLLLARGDYAIVHKSIVAIRLMRREI
jgi:hypothetical protein